MEMGSSVVRPSGLKQVFKSAIPTLIISLMSHFHIFYAIIHIFYAVILLCLPECAEHGALRQGPPSSDHRQPQRGQYFGIGFQVGDQNKISVQLHFIIEL